MDVLLSEVEQKLSHFSIVIDTTIYFKNAKMIGCSGIEYKSFNFELQEPIKAFTGRFRSYLSNIDGLVV